MKSLLFAMAVIVVLCCCMAPRRVSLDGTQPPTLESTETVESLRVNAIEYCLDGFPHSRDGNPHIVTMTFNGNVLYGFDCEVK